MYNIILKNIVFIIIVLHTLCEYTECPRYPSTDNFYAIFFFRKY